MKTCNAVGFGLAIGFVFTVGFSILFMGLNEVSAQFLAWMIASALYGLSSRIFDIKALHTAVAAVIHFVVCLSITSVNLYLFYRPYLGSVLIGFVVTYIIMFVIMGLVERHKMKQINEKLKQNQ